MSIFPTRATLQAWFLFACILQNSSLAAQADDSACTQSDRVPRRVETQVREFSPYLDGKWIGRGIAYGAYRQGQSPGGNLPTLEELAEDIDLLSRHWNLIRLYGSREVSEDVLNIICEKKLPLRVMLGAWIARESESATYSPALLKTNLVTNRKEVEEAIRLANAYPDEVIAVSVGNETQVDWSNHLTRPEVLIRHIRTVRDAVVVPVTTADDFKYWLTPESKRIAKEIDFVVTHVHPMWAGVGGAKALSWTESTYADVCKYHPGKTVVLGETGWATRVHNEGLQAKLIKGKAGELEQRLFYRQFSDWATKNKICTFYFEAFDEPWKGGSHPNDVEKHWGVFHVNRKPKPAIARMGKE